MSQRSVAVEHLAVGCVELFSVLRELFLSLLRALGSVFPILGRLLDDFLLEACRAGNTWREGGRDGSINQSVEESVLEHHRFNRVVAAGIELEYDRDVHYLEL